VVRIALATRGRLCGQTLGSSPAAALAQSGWSRKAFAGRELGQWVMRCAGGRGEICFGVALYDTTTNMEGSTGRFEPRGRSRSRRARSVALRGAMPRCLALQKHQEAEEARVFRGFSLSSGPQPGHTLGSGLLPTWPQASPQATARRRCLPLGPRTRRKWDEVDELFLGGTGFETDRSGLGAGTRAARREEGGPGGCGC